MAPKRMYVIYQGRFPSERAASLFVAKSCEVFADEGVDLVLLVPRRIGRIFADPFEYYGIKRNFAVRFLPILDFYRFGVPDSINFLIISATFGISSAWHALRHAKKAHIIYSNEILPLWLVSFFLPNTFYEMHDFPESKLGLFGRFCRRMRWLLIHNKWKAEKFRKLFPDSASKVLYQPNAVDIALFDISVAKEEARKLLHLASERYMVVYTGSLFGWKGVDTLARAADNLPESVTIAFIGGSADDIARFRERYGAHPRIRIEGHRPHNEIPLWQKAADVLILPNTAKEDISKYYTSPMKLFEYMASKRPVVASRIPSITEIVDDEMAILVEPDDPEALAAGIRRVIQDPRYSDTMVEKAFTEVRRYTWEKRARTILDFIGK